MPMKFKTPAEWQAHLKRARAAKAAQMPSSVEAADHTVNLKTLAEHQSRQRAEAKLKAEEEAKLLETKQ